MRSEFWFLVDEVQGLVATHCFGLGVRLARIVKFNLPEDSQHVAKPKTEYNSRRNEPEHSQSHTGVNKERRYFISQVEIFFIVDVISSILIDKSIECTSSTKTV